jgi:hypothetical protein
MADGDMTWARLDPAYVPPEIDTTVPSVARVYDAILGGKDNFAVDRAVADEAMRTMADGGNGARLNRAALGRAVRYMSDRGISQFLDLGSGLPAAQNTHQIAQAANSEARVVYVDNDRCNSGCAHGMRRAEVWLWRAPVSGGGAGRGGPEDVRAREPRLAVTLSGTAGLGSFGGVPLSVVTHPRSAVVPAEQVLPNAGRTVGE